MMRLVVLVLGLSCFGSALAVVYSSHESRKLFIELQALQEMRDELDVEWGRMQLEQSTWATHGRIEATAREKLSMRLPAPDGVQVVRP